MTQPGEFPDAPRHGPLPAAAPGPAALASPRSVAARLRGPLIALLATAAASAVLGLCAGLIWSAVAPRALLVVQSRGVAYVLNDETSVFIVADAWFCLLTAIGGLICGVAGYFAAVRRYGAVAVAGLVLGGLAASVLARWVGQQQGQAHFQSLLGSSQAGAQLHQPLALGGQGPLAFWPLLAALAVGTIELFSQSMERRREDQDGEPPA
jgi:fermentation-respiration switch protein FrsA (DUF1100 family)